jgi:hypothetical protein
MEFSHQRLRYLCTYNIYFSISYFLNSSIHHLIYVYLASTHIEGNIFLVPCFSKSVSTYDSSDNVMHQMWHFVLCQEQVMTLVTSRVTRLSEFSPIGCLFTLGSFLKITEVAQICWLRFPNVSVIYLFRQKMG